MSIFHTIGSVSHGTLIPQDLAHAFAECLVQLIAARTTSGDPIPELDTAERQSRAGALIEILAALDIASALNLNGKALAEFESWLELEYAELAEGMHDFLDEIAPAGIRFGAHEGDGSDFGFWDAELGGGSDFEFWDAPAGIRFGAHEGDDLSS